MEKRCYPSYSDVETLIRRSAADIENNFSPDCIVAVGSGGVVPATILKELLEVPIYFVSVKSSCTGDDHQVQESREIVQWVEKNTLEKYKRVLFVDDMIDTGATLIRCVLELNLTKTYNIFSNNETAAFVLYKKREATDINTMFDYIKVACPADVPTEVHVVFPWEREQIVANNNHYYFDIVWRSSVSLYKFIFKDSGV